MPSVTGRDDPPHCVSRVALSTGLLLARLRPVVSTVVAR